MKKKIDYNYSSLDAAIKAAHVMFNGGLKSLQTKERINEKLFCATYLPDLEILWEFGYLTYNLKIINKMIDECVEDELYEGADNLMRVKLWIKNNYGL